MNFLAFDGRGARPKPGRVEWIDCAKGVGILLVVLAHGWRGLIDNGQMHWMYGLQAVDYAIYSFHMPLFFFLSGLTSSYLPKGRWAFLISKAKTVVYPYFLWSSLVGLILIMVGKGANTHFTWVDFLTLPWLPIQQFWFLQALFFCQVLKSVVLRNDMLLGVCAVLYSISAISTNYSSTILTIFHFSLFFAMGAYLAKRNIENKGKVYVFS